MTHTIQAFVSPDLMGRVQLADLSKNLSNSCAPSRLLGDIFESRRNPLEFCLLPRLLICLQEFTVPQTFASCIPTLHDPLSTTSMAAESAARKCMGGDCENDAGTLQCPTCLKLGMKDSYFCSQDCFKRNWVCFGSDSRLGIILRGERDSHDLLSHLAPRCHTED